MNDLLVHSFDEKAFRAPCATGAANEPEPSEARSTSQTS